MKRTVALLFLMLAGAGVFAADPYAGYIYPSGIQAGTTNRFIVGGQNMWRLRGMHFGCKGLRVLDIKSVPGFSPPPGKQRLHLKNWLDGIAKGVKEEPAKPEDPHISEWRSNSCGVCLVRSIRLRYRLSNAIFSRPAIRFRMRRLSDR